MTNADHTDPSQPGQWGPAASSPQTAPPLPAPAPTVVHVVAKRGGFSRAVGFIIGLMVFAAVFIIGLTTGVLSALATPSPMILPQEYRSGGANKVAVIPVSGVIDQNQSGFVRAAVNEVLDDRSIKAVVLRVDSPGGGVTPSDQIWYQVNRLKAAKLPVVASFGSMAASGGYYVSCNTDRILAEPTTITGSIGVIAQVLTMEGLMDKVGVEPVTLVATGSPQKDVANDVFRSWNKADREKITTMLDAAYDTFFNRVMEGRGAPVQEKGVSSLRQLANGSIYTAEQALSTGLVDELGYFDDAIAAAEGLANLPADSAKVIVLREPPSLFGPGGYLVRSARSAGTMTLDADTIRGLVNELGAPRVMYLMR